jgi:hypothetical protein
LLLENIILAAGHPFDENSVTARLTIYIYTVIAVLIMKLNAGSVTSVMIGTLIYTSLQFKFVSKSLEDLSNMEYSDRSQTELNEFSILDEQHTCGEFNYTDCQDYATNIESLQIPSQAKVLVSFKTHKYRNAKNHYCSPCEGPRT